MVDLRATNEKLKARSVRILRLLTGLHDSKATSLLNRCNGEVKVAIVCNRRDVEPDTARDLLSEHEGHLRPILDEHPVSQPNGGN
jgi:N-acetylmuramic acid 6-phosphate etherase